MTNSPPETIALAIAPKITAFLSMCGSSTIIFKILRNHKTRRETMPRIMVGISICDMMTNAWFFAGTWAIPEGTITSFGDGTQTIFGAIGTDLSCNIAGFFNQFQVASALFNSTLATYYLLVVYYGWTKRRIKKIEWLFYTIPISYALITATFAVAANLIGPVEWTCWIKPPEYFVDGAEPTPIQSQFKSIQWIALFIPVWICIVYVSIIFTNLYKKMRALEIKMERYDPGINHSNMGAPLRVNSPIHTDRGERGSIGMEDSVNQSGTATSTHSAAKNSQRIAVQGMLYVLAFYLTYLFPTITSITLITAGKAYFPVQFLDTFFIPLQGFWNCCIYLRPSIQKHLESHPNDSVCTAILHVVIGHDNDHD